jgi:hypothetical protein
VRLSDEWLLNIYGAALWLYPPAFRVRYGEAMRDAVVCSHAESSGDLRFFAALAWDLVCSIVREHMRASAALTGGYVAAFAVFFSAILLVVSVGHQQVLRRGADRGPEMRADDARRGSEPALGPGGGMEISSEDWLNGTSAFAVVYDAEGRAIAGDATLNGRLPQPPPGVFAVIRERGVHKVTWQPRPGIRVALVGETLPQGGFVLAGQSLEGSETKTSRFDRFLVVIWMMMLVGLCVGGLLRRPATQK